MKKSLVRVLIILISLVLCGLIATQLFWINNAIELKNEEFERTVNDVLETVVITMEEKEAIENLRLHQELRYLFFDEDTLQGLNRHASDTGLGYLIVKDIKNDGGRISIRVTEKRNGEEVDNVITRNVTSLDSLDLEELVSMKLMLSYRDSRQGIRISEGRLDSILQKRVMHKTAFVEDVVKRLFRVNLYAKLEDRIDKKQLDSIMRAEFANQGIVADFSYGVMNSMGEIVLCSEDADIDELKQSKFKVEIFPNDIIQGTNYLKVSFMNRTGLVLLMLWKVLLLSAIVILAIILIFTYSINTIIRQRKLSALRAELINNMTHELKTPISTIALACEALVDKAVNKDQERSERYIGMIQEENKRLGVMVQNVLQSAVLDKGKFKLNYSDVNIHALIEKVMERIAMQVREKGGKLTKSFLAENPVVKADPMHLTNVIYNLLDNANKYCDGNPRIIISTENAYKGLLVKVEDNGIGIRKEDQHRVFERLYRVPSGNVHNVKGFGLGLSYVKIIIEKHGGEVSVRSNPGKGSTFSVYLPAK
ncbi:MAG: sensor histidine kinase [Flavobacteriales bacterium]